MRTPFAPDVDSYCQSLAYFKPQIQFINLPLVSPPLQELDSPEKFITVFVECHKPHVKEAIASHILSNESLSLVGLLADSPCTSVVDVANELGVPFYCFFTSGAACLRLLHDHLYDHDHQETHDDDDDMIIVPSYVNPVPSRVLPSFLRNKEDRSVLKNHVRRLKGANVIIVNTFHELEPLALRSFQNVYAVGPLVDLEGHHHPLGTLTGTQRGEIMKWLDEQPPQSVVFLCFGSVGSFSETQLKEIAVGLERSGHRFLWSIRRPPPPPPPKDGMAIDVMPSDYPHFQDIFTDGFLERTKGRAVVCGWAPQMEVLAHRAVGGFVSHCGWNSILESLWHGVPIVTWPMYGEQQINAFQMVRDMGLAVELRLDYDKDKDDFVSAGEIEKAIISVMDSDSEVRRRVKEMSQTSREAVVEGGSSFAAFGDLIEAILGNQLS